MYKTEVEKEMKNIINILDNSNQKEVKRLEELKRRVEITYRTRINSASRLREENEVNKKLNIYYSALITIMSVISIGTGTYTKQGNNISLIVLASSITLTYYMFYISEQNLQERAYRMEETYKSLGILRNKIAFLLDDENLSRIKCEKLYREYEHIIGGIENHKPIDYDMHRVRTLDKEKETDRYNEVKKSVDKYIKKKKRKKFASYALPGLMSGIIIIQCLTI